ADSKNEKVDKEVKEGAKEEEEEILIDVSLL
ncbi:hypothetical protein F8M41_024081, partial [Gigaspora margarita]